MDLEQLRQMMRDGTLGAEKTTSEKLRDVAARTPREAGGKFKKPVKKDDLKDGDVLKEVRLEYRQGNSDKVYILKVIVAGAGGDAYRVTAQYGKRGKALRDAAKGAFTNLTSALETFDKVMDEKISKGYRRA